MLPPVLPGYGASSLADLVPSIGAALGLSYESSLNLPASDRYVILLIDGLGDALLTDAAKTAPFLSSCVRSTLTSSVPSTTATALSTLGTGLTPGEHGIAGFSFRHPFSDAVLNSLAWERGLSGLDVQPRLTMFERLGRQGVTVASVLPATFEGSGLTEAGLRGTRVWGVVDETVIESRVEQIVDAAASGPKTLVYAYERVLDHEGHGHGVDSDAWRAALRFADALASEVRRALPADVRLVITGDHGMLDVPKASRVIIEDEPDLREGVSLVAGEARFRHLFSPDAPGVAQRWRDRLGETAWVRTRDEASDEGWLGWLSPGMARRFGDVIVAAADDSAILTRTMPKEHQLIGMHGSLTRAEMIVPLIVE